MLRINPIDNFDANFDYKINIVSNYDSGYFVVYIIDTIVGNLFYSKTVEASDVIIIEKNILNNGRKYAIYIEYKNNISTPSHIVERSNSVYFKCFSTPKFNFVPISNPITSSVVTLHIEYSQNENDKLKNYEVVYYKEGEKPLHINGNPLPVSHNLYSYNGLLSYTLAGLEDGKYYATAYGVTANGLKCQTETIELLVANNNPNTTYDLLELKNDACNGYISYKTYILIIQPHEEYSSPDYVYINGCVDLRGGKYLYYDKNIKLNNDFSLALFCKDLDKDATYFVALNKDKMIFKISSYYYPHKKIYKIILTTMSGDIEVEHYSQDLLGKNVKIIINKQNELYQLNVKEG